MERKEIGPSQYNNLPRRIKRELQRQAKKEGRVLPEKLRERAKITTSIDSELFHEGLPIIEKMGHTVESFMDLAFANIIKAKMDVTRPQSRTRLK